MNAPIRPAAPPSDPGDLGFGSVVAGASGTRLLNRDGTFTSARRGVGRRESQQVYHLALSSTWPRFLLTAATAYLAVNVGFALLYLACGPDALGGAPAATLGGAFWRAFFFSVETFATIGYGEISPVGVPAHLLVVVESFVAIVLQALATGFVFARFARPSAALRFSRDMVIAPYQGGRAAMFRLVNTRQNEMIDLRARVTFTARDGTGQGMGRRFARLALERESVDLLPLAWTVVHPITESSPLWGMDEATMRAQEVEFLVLCSGIDDTVQQAVYTRTSYRAEEVVWGARFANMYLPVGHDGRIAIDVRRLNTWERVPLPDDPPAPAPSTTAAAR